MKQIIDLRHAPEHHWVGDGLPVHGMFDYNSEGVAARSPFLLLDYGAPYEFAPTTKRLGVGTHPHRGFETVTFVYSGELAHRDNTGAGGVIGPGDVQWMTAGGGILHEEFHSEGFAARGGTLEMAQLWVNLPARDKMTPAAYQTITAADIPQCELPDGAGSVRVVAGEWNGVQGPARTFSPMNVLDVRLGAGRQAALAQPEGWATLVVIASGSVAVNGHAAVRGPAVFTLSTHGSGVELVAATDSKLLLLAGKPLDEPVVGYGPFVMNSREEILAAIDDFNAGRFGRSIARSHEENAR